MFSEIHPDCSRCMQAKTVHGLRQWLLTLCKKPSSYVWDARGSKSLPLWQSGMNTLGSASHDERVRGEMDMEGRSRSNCNSRVTRPLACIDDLRCRPWCVCVRMVFSGCQSRHVESSFDLQRILPWVVHSFLCWHVDFMCEASDRIRMALCCKAKIFWLFLHPELKKRQTMLHAYSMKLPDA